MRNTATHGVQVTEMPLTALITGGSGYLGQFLVEEFARTDRVRLSWQHKCLMFVPRIRSANGSLLRVIAILRTSSLFEI